MKPTEIQLKLALAEELTESIIVEGGAFFWNQGRYLDGSEPAIHSTEWLYVIRQVEKKLTIEQQTDYCNKLWPNGTFVFNAINAPWQTRAIAYFATIGKQI